MQKTGVKTFFIHFNFSLKRLCKAIIPKMLVCDSLLILPGWLEDGSNFPNPVTDPEGCGQNHPGYLCDPDHLLTNKQGK